MAKTRETAQQQAPGTEETNVTPVETHEALGLGSEASIGLLEQTLNTATSAWMASMMDAFGSLNALIMSMQRLPLLPSATETRTWTPLFGVDQHGDTLLVSAELPGYEPKNLHVEIQEGRKLLISGERKTQTRETTASPSMVVTEEVLERFEESLNLSQPVDSQHVDADLTETGHLQITLPIKTAEMQNRTSQ